MDVERLQFIKVAAARLGVSYSALTDYLLQVGASALTPEQVREWASKQPRKRGAPSSEDVRLRGSEARVVEVLTSEWMELREVQAAAGTGAKVTFRALQGLVKLGLAEWREGEPGFLREDTKTPLKSHWRRVVVPSGA